MWCYSISDRTSQKLRIYCEGIVLKNTCRRKIFVPVGVDKEHRRRRRTLERENALEEKKKRRREKDEN